MRKLALIVLAAVFVVIAVVWWRTAGRCPIQMRVSGVERLQIVDESGREMPAGTIAFTNCADATVYIGKQTITHARVRGEWKRITPVAQPNQLRGLSPHMEADEMLFLPADAEGFRLTLEYELTPWKLRFLNSLPISRRKWIVNTPWLRSFFLPTANSAVPRVIQWKHATFEADIPAPGFQ